MGAPARQFCRAGVDVIYSLERVWNMRHGVGSWNPWGWCPHIGRWYTKTLAPFTFWRSFETLSLGMPSFPHFSGMIVAPASLRLFSSRLKLRAGMTTSSESLTVAKMGMFAFTSLWAAFIGLQSAFSSSSRVIPYSSMFV